MILDSGICSVFAKVNTAEPGRKPVFGYQLITKGWFAKLDFSSQADWQTERREEVRVDLRIRILQDTRANNHCVVVLRDTDAPEEGDTLYEVVRAFHGSERESGALISDLSLEVVA